MRMSPIGSKTSMKAAVSLALAFFALVGFLIFLDTPSAVQAFAPGDVQACTNVRNLSNSPGYTSVDPLLLASRDGIVHLFWAERIYGEPDAIPNVPDALVYSSWDGSSWSSPIDIFLSPRERFNKRINGIRGVIDEDGYIHLVWIGPDNLFFYSSTHATEASVAGSWRNPVTLATDQSGTQYSVDIASSGSNTLHVIYGQENASGRSNRSLRYIRSVDGGRTWSLPKDIFVFPQLDRGPSNTRIIVGENDRLYATWTEWDSTGNGQAIYFARSLDGGDSWEQPTVLDKRLGNEYERDWVTLAVLGEDELVAFWEGGWRAYRQAQYSTDGGETWSEPVDTLDWLIADNGFAEFVRDSTGRLHLFVFQRVREGNDDKGNLEGLWHTTLDAERTWREPQLVGNPSKGNFVSVAIKGGNELFAAWFDYTDFEIFVMQCQIEGADPVEPQPWTNLAPVGESEEATNTLEPTPPSATDTEEMAIDAPSPPNSSISRPADNPAYALVLGMAPVLLLIVVVVGFYMHRQRFS